MVGRAKPTTSHAGRRLNAVEELRQLVTAMDELGVTHYAKDGVVIDRPLRAPGSPSITETEKAGMRMATAKHMEAILFASSEGFPIEDEPEAVK